MSKIRKLVPNVLAFLEKACDDYARIQGERFSQQMFSELVDWDSDSPIEDIFWMACHVQCASVGTDVNHCVWVGPGQYARADGIHITPQYKVGNYKVDFLLEQQRIGPDEILTPIAVELDGHDFHDRDKRQRSYEKARDRELQRQGLKVIHFTGSDVIADPYKVAFEALSFIGVFCGTGRDEYNPKDPLGQGWGE